MRSGPYLEYAPSSEQEVVLLFGLLLPWLPEEFRLDEVRTAYPDCLASRIGPSGASQPLRIEFELFASNFRDHRHAIDGCDLIVCWEDDLGDGFPIPRLALRDIVLAADCRFIANPDRSKFPTRVWTRDAYLDAVPPLERSYHCELLDWADRHGQVRYGRGEKHASWTFRAPAPYDTRPSLFTVYADGHAYPGGFQLLPPAAGEAFKTRLAEVAAPGAMSKSWFTLDLGVPAVRQTLMAATMGLLNALTTRQSASI